MLGDSAFPVTKRGPWLFLDTQSYQVLKRHLDNYVIMLDDQRPRLKHTFDLKNQRIAIANSADFPLYQRGVAHIQKNLEYDGTINVWLCNFE